MRRKPLPGQMSFGQVAPPPRSGESARRETCLRILSQARWPIMLYDAFMSPLWVGFDPPMTKAMVKEVLVALVEDGRVTRELGPDRFWVYSVKAQES